VTLHPEHIDVAITDNGAGPPGDTSGRYGNGLRGIAERVSLLGGALSTGRAPGGGYAVHAHLPVLPTEVRQ